MHTSNVVVLTAECQRLLGDPAAFEIPNGYPHSLALCIVDSVQSTGVKYGSVGHVVDRYRGFRRERGAEPETDSAPDLLSTFDELGGEQAWADTIGNQSKTSSHRGAPLKAVAIHREAKLLRSLGIDTTADLRTAAQGDGYWDIRREWTKVVGQRSGITWHYALMLAGVPGVKPDRMILRFVAKALDMRVRDVPLSLAVDVITSTAGELGIPVTALDHAIWQYQSGLARNQRP